MLSFAGDFRQLEPVGDSKPLYKCSAEQFEDFVNCYIELLGLHRFSEDMQWGKLLQRFRDGKVTRNDLELINTRVLQNDSQIPDDIQYATFRNRDRDAINTALFEKRCIQQFHKNGDLKDTVLILSDKL